MTRNPGRDPVEQSKIAASAPDGEPPAGAVARKVSSRELLGEAGELVIVHGGREYRLRLTQHGRLILTA